MPLLTDYDIAAFSSRDAIETDRIKDGWVCAYRSVFNPALKDTWQQCDPLTRMIWIWKKSL